MLNKFKQGGFFDRERENDPKGTYEGKVNKLPSSFVRSASFEKLKSGNSLTERSESVENSLAGSRNNGKKISS